MAALASSGCGTDALFRSKARLSELPDGTYTLKDIATRWPHLLVSAMQVYGDALKQPRKTTFHSTSGVVNLERRRQGDARDPSVKRRDADEVVFTICAGATPRVRVAEPQRQNS